MKYDFQTVATLYMEKGIAVLPLEAGDKKPLNGYKWGDKQLTKEELKNIPPTSNIGMILGERSGGIVDFDFDRQEAQYLIPHIALKLKFFGRTSSRYAHGMAMCKDAGQTIQYGLSKKEGALLGISEGKLMILELRSSGSYTMIPPSIHPSGEPLCWHANDELPEHDWETLVRHAGLLAFLAVILIAYPRQRGARDEICMALAGTLLRFGLSVDEADDLVVKIAELADDEEVQKRRKAQAAKDRLDAGEDVTGLPRLCELLGIEELQKKLIKWLYGSKAPVTSEHLEAETAIAMMNEKFFVIENEGGKCLVGFFQSEPAGSGRFRETLACQTSSEFMKRFVNRPVVVGYNQDGKPMLKPLGKFWFEHLKRHQYARVVFFPGGEASPDELNLWRGFGVTPKKGSWKRMQRHIWRVLAKRDRAAFRYILKWCAWAVQNPDSPAEVALVFRGGKGTGKGTFCNAMVSMFGVHGLAVASAQHITGRFNRHLRDCVLLFSDEAIAPNDKPTENVLKSLITEPRLAIEGKGVDIIPSLNYLHVIMASNADWVVPASHDERRFAVFEISDEYARREDWFRPLNDEIKNGGLEAMLDFFLNLDLKGWHPRRDIPENGALNDQRVQSLRGLDRAWFDCLTIGEAYGTLHDGCITINTKGFAKYTRTSPKSTGDYLRKMGCSQDRIASVGRGWRTPPLEKARQIWDKKMFKVDWDDTAEWSVPQLDNYEDPPDVLPF